MFFSAYQSPSVKLIYMTGIQKMTYYCNISYMYVDNLSVNPFIIKKKQILMNEIIVQSRKAIYHGD